VAEAVVGQPAGIVRSIAADGRAVLCPTGAWTLMNITDLAPRLARFQAEAGDDCLWDCSRIALLDSAGALLLWRAWGRKLPEALILPEALQPAFTRLATADAVKPTHAPPRSPFDPLIGLGRLALAFAQHVLDFVVLTGRIALDLLHLLRHPGDAPWREFSATLYKAGVCSMPVTALVGFLIGVVLAYLSSLQLRQYGADVFIVHILGLGLIRELGPVLVAVLVAGRSGSAMTAQLGVMRVTEEIDALAALGVSRSLRLVLPKVLAMAIAVPLLVVWTTTIALIGGMLAAQWQLDIGTGYFIATLPRVVPEANLWIGLSKGLAFGLFIALIACHYGLRVQPNTESLAANTTASVVSAITVVILIDALFAIATRSIGLPK